LKDSLTIFGNDVLAVLATLLSVLGPLDDKITAGFHWFGIDPARQLIIMVFLTMIIVWMAAARVIGGFYGWILVLFFVLLLCHRLLYNMPPAHVLVPGPSPWVI